MANKFNIYKSFLVKSTRTLDPKRSSTFSNTLFIIHKFETRKAGYNSRDTSKSSAVKVVLNPRRTCKYVEVSGLF